MNKSYSKIRHIQEANLNLEKRLIGESIISEQAGGTFLNVFPSVAALTTRDVKTQPLLGGTNGTNIIFLSKRDANGRIVPNTKFSYKLTGRYKFIPFDITLRNVSRDSSGVLRAEVLPNNGFVRTAMKTLIGKQYLTNDGWLIIAAPNDKINAALVQLYNNKGSEAKLSLNGGVDISLEQVQ